MRGSRREKTLLLLCVYTRRSQPDYCVVIHPKIKWNQILTIHFSVQPVENINLQPEMQHMWSNM